MNLINCKYDNIVDASILDHTKALVSNIDSLRIESIVAVGYSFSRGNSSVIIDLDYPFKDNNLIKMVQNIKAVVREDILNSIL